VKQRASVKHVLDEPVIFAARRTQLSAAVKRPFAQVGGLYAHASIALLSIAADRIA